MIEWLHKKRSQYSRHVNSWKLTPKPTIIGTSPSQQSFVPLLTPWNNSRLSQSKLDDEEPFTP